MKRQRRGEDETSDHFSLAAAFQSRSINDFNSEKYLDKATRTDGMMIQRAQYS